MSENISNHLKKPEPNWWSEETWYNWFKELKEIVDDSTNSEIVYHINSISYPEQKHWSRWVLWFEDLRKIVQKTNQKETP